MSDRDRKLNSTSIRNSRILVAKHPGAAEAGNEAEIHPVTGHRPEGG